MVQRTPTASRPLPTDVVDALVVGAGAGGLGAALTLAEAGRSVLVCEALAYPGGCASTFSRQGYRFDAGATLSAGLGRGQLLRTWLDRHKVDLDIELLDPVMVVRAPGLVVPIPRDREAFLAGLCAQPGVPEAATRRFFALQARVADALWHVIDRPELLPPLSLHAVLHHAARAPHLRDLPWLVGRPLVQVLERFGLADCRPVRTVVDALCQITVQTDAAQAEAPFAMAALDYPWRGTGHVRGGIGRLMEGLAQAVEHAGGQVALARRVQDLTRRDGLWHANVRGQSVRARQVFANTLPADLAALADPASPLDQRQGRVATGWGAIVLYLGLDSNADLPPGAHHTEIVQDPSAPLPGGNHMLVSVSDVRDTERAPTGQRVATVSTHVDVSALGDDPAAAVAAIQERLRQGLRDHLPELAAHIVAEHPGSPRTFQRFTRRRSGLVGGIPRRVGLGQYFDVFPRPVQPGLWMVGDSVLLGQSVLAAATGGQRTAVAAMQRDRIGGAGHRAPLP